MGLSENRVPRHHWGPKTPFADACILGQRCTRHVPSTSVVVGDLSKYSEFWHLSQILLGGSTAAFCLARKNNMPIWAQQAKYHHQCWTQILPKWLWQKRMLWYYRQPTCVDAKASDDPYWNTVGIFPHLTGTTRSPSKWLDISADFPKKHQSTWRSYSPRGIISIICVVDPKNHPKSPEAENSSSFRSKIQSCVQGPEGAGKGGDAEVVLVDKSRFFWFMKRCLFGSAPRHSFFLPRNWGHHWDWWSTGPCRAAFQLGLPFCTPSLQSRTIF